MGIIFPPGTHGSNTEILYFIVIRETFHGSLETVGIYVNLETVVIYVYLETVGIFVYFETMVIYVYLETVRILCFVRDINFYPRRTKDLNLKIK